MKTNYKNTLQEAVSKISTPENEASSNCNNSNYDFFFSRIWKEPLSPLTTRMN